MPAIVEPTRHKLSISDFERLGQAGILVEDTRVELIEGDLIDMPPIGARHMAIDIRLIRLLVRRVGDEAIVSAGHPMRLPPWSMPQPDLVLLRPRADDYITRHPGAADVLLAIEVADSSLRYDLGTKARLYAMHRIAEYWVVDVDGRRLHVLRGPITGEGRFSTVQTLQAPFTVAPLALPTLSIESAEIWLDADRPDTGQD